MAGQCTIDQSNTDYRYQTTSDVRNYTFIGMTKIDKPSVGLEQRQRQTAFYTSHTRNV